MTAMRRAARIRVPRADYPPSWEAAYEDERSNVDSRKSDGCLGIPALLWNPVNQEAALGKVRPLAIFEPAPSDFGWAGRNGCVMRLRRGRSLRACRTASHARRRSGNGSRPRAERLPSPHRSPTARHAGIALRGATGAQKAKAVWAFETRPLKSGVASFGAGNPLRARGRLPVRVAGAAAGLRRQTSWSESRCLPF